MRFAVAVAGGLAYGLVARLVFSGGGDAVFATMSVAFVFLVPLAVGFTAVSIARRSGRVSLSSALALPFLVAVLCLAAAFVTRWESLVCIVMMLPVFVVMSALGGLAARIVPGGRPGAAALALAVLLPYLAAPVEALLPQPVGERVVEDRARIHAGAATVWANVVRISEIRAEEYPRGLAHRLGFPRPVEATLTREGVGGVRRGRFERGVAVTETITRWEPPRRLEVKMDVDPESIPPGVLDAHVAVGGQYFDVLDGAYEIEQTGDGGVVLHLRSTHRLRTRFNVYAGLWTGMVMHQVHRDILAVVRRRSEAAEAARASR